MTATYYDEDEQEQEVTLDSREIVEYAPQIISALQSESGAWRSARSGGS